MTEKQQPTSAQRYYAARLRVLRGRLRHSTDHIERGQLKEEIRAAKDALARAAPPAQTAVPKPPAKEKSHGR